MSEGKDDEKKDDAKKDDKKKDDVKSTTKNDSKLSLWIMLIFALALLISIMLDAPIIAKLTDPAVARGLITFTISIATIGLAFTLVYHAFYVDDENDDKYRKAREVFTGLMGILGTIVGFYFGTVEPISSRLEVADIKVEGQLVRTHIIGGVPPIKFSISSDFDGFTSIKNQISDDGWISVKLASAIPKGKTITIEVTDSKDRKATRDKKIDEQYLPEAISSESTSYGSTSKNQVSSQVSSRASSSSQ